MDKKDIYEHLAKIYLDASSSKKRKKRKKSLALKSISIGAAFIIGTGIFLFFSLHRQKAVTSELALLICPDPVKLNFHFDPAKKESYTVNLNKLNLARFKALGFSVKKVNYQDTISLRVEFTNAFREKSEVYLKNIPYKWQDYRLAFSEFKNITDWSEVQELAFVIEEWNVRENRGVVYVDNVRFLR